MNNIFFLVFISVLLHCSKKVQSSVIASCRSPWYHADVGVAWSQVSRQWPFLILWPSQHVCSHSHVLLLHDVCHGTSISKVCTALCDYVNTFATDLWRVYWLRYQPPKEMLLLKSQIKSFLFMKFWFVEYKFFKIWCFCHILAKINRERVEQIRQFNNYVEPRPFLLILANPISLMWAISLETCSHFVP